MSEGTQKSRLEKVDRDPGEEQSYVVGVDYGSASRRRQQQDPRALNAI